MNLIFKSDFFEIFYRDKKFLANSIKNLILKIDA